MSTKRIASRILSVISRRKQASSHGKARKVELTIEQLTVHLNNFNGICPYCVTPVKLWIKKGPMCVSTDRLNNNLDYTTDNIQFVHVECNKWERHQRNYDITKLSYRERLENLSSCRLVEPTDREGIEILKNNIIYLNGTKTEQLKLESLESVTDKTQNIKTNKNMKSNNDLRTYNTQINGFNISASVEFYRQLIYNVVTIGNVSTTNKVGLMSGIACPMELAQEFWDNVMSEELKQKFSPRQMVQAMIDHYGENKGDLYYFIGSLKNSGIIKRHSSGSSTYCVVKKTDGVLKNA